MGEAAKVEATEETEAAAQLDEEVEEWVDSSAEEAMEPESTEREVDLEKAEVELVRAATKAEEGKEDALVEERASPAGEEVETEREEAKEAETDVVVMEENVAVETAAAFEAVATEGGEATAGMEGRAVLSSQTQLLQTQSSQL